MASATGLRVRIHIQIMLEVMKNYRDNAETSPQKISVWVDQARVPVSDGVRAIKQPKGVVHTG